MKEHCSKREIIHEPTSECCVCCSVSLKSISLRELNMVRNSVSQKTYFSEQRKINKFYKEKNKSLYDSKILKNIRKQKSKNNWKSSINCLNNYFEK